ncbi:MAG: hypothetical protein KAX05_15935 [Bacteroidales bacterium]|nr:hypothetical protein [Bacteroidales bacterium]
MKTIKDVVGTISKIDHPAINYSLIDLGIVTDIELIENKVVLVFAFPFPNIPITNALINSISQPIQALDLDFEYSIRVMTEEEKSKFMQMEAKAWKG